LFQAKFGSNVDKPKCWVKNVIQKCTVTTQIWVGTTFVSNMDKPKFWAKNLIKKKCAVESES